MPKVSAQATQVDVGGWVLRSGVTLFFLTVGYDHLNADPNGEWFQIFARIGVGQWFRVATGVVETTGAALYLFPGTCRVGAGILAAAMVGAILAHIFVLGDPFSSIIPGGLIAIVLVIALREPDADPAARWGRRKRNV